MIDTKVFVPPEDTKWLMHVAQRENFAIYLLRGILGIVTNRCLRNEIPTNLRGEIELACMQSIECIKDKQRIRMANNPNPKKREPV